MKVQTTFALAGSLGYVIPLTDTAGNAVTCRFLQITADIGTDCWVQGAYVAPGATPPAAPTNAVIPASGNSKPYISIGNSAAGKPQQVTLTWDRGSSDTSTHDVYTHVIVFGNGAAGNLEIVGN